MLQDIRFAFRLLFKNLAFTAIAVVTLGLAVAANTVVFSIVNAILIRPLPYGHPEQLVRVYTGHRFLAEGDFWVSPPEYLDVSAEAKSFESVGAWNTRQANLTGGERPIAIRAAFATSTLLPTLGVAPMLGRFYDESEDQPGDPRAIVLSYGLFQTVFGGDASIVGKTVYFDAWPVTVVGVMPKGIKFPDDAQAWVPFRYDKAHIPRDRRHGHHSMMVLARLKPGVTLESARAELGVLMSQWGSRKTEFEHEDVIDAVKHTMTYRALQEDQVAKVRLALLMLQAAVVFVLLIACANISNLLLARAEARSGEIAVRAALGASRMRIMRQFLTESLVLGIVGAGFGVLLAMWGLDGALALLPEGVPRQSEIQLDTTVLLFAVGISVFTSLVFGLAPILHAHGNLGGTLRAAGQRTTDGRSKQLFRRSLIVLEVALAIVLVIGAGLMVRSFIRMQQVELGYDPRNLLTLNLQLPEKAYPTAVEVDNFWTRLRDGAANLPGVTSATLMDELPPHHEPNFNGFGMVGKVWSEGMPVWNVKYWQIAGDEYFSTMRIPVLRGRVFQRSDDVKSPVVGVINESMAKRFWPNEDPIGQRILPFRVAYPGEPFVEMTIVGVVADARQQGVDTPAGPELFFAARQMGAYRVPQPFDLTPRAVNLVIRTEGDPRALMGTVRAHVASLDPNLPISELSTMDGLLYEAIAKPRFVTMLLTAFAGIALLMAAIGIFGVMSYSVERRTKELSIRMALGADAGRLQRMLVFEGLGLAAIGVAVGLVAAGIMTVALGNWLAGLLFDIGGFDPLTYVLVVASTGVVAMVACYLPARRATRIHPMTAMRHE